MDKGNHASTDPAVVMEPEMRERVLMLVLNLDVGGLERMVIDLCAGVSAQGYAVSVCTLEDEGALSERLKEHEIEVFALHRTQLGKEGTVSALNSLIAELDVQILHSHNSAALYYAARATKFRPNLVHIWTRHGVGDKSPKAILRDRIAVANTDQIVAVSEDLANDCVKKRFMPNAKIRLIENGINLEPFSTTTRTKNDPLRIGHIARISPVKNQSRLLRVFAEFQRLRTGAELIIVGDGEELGRLKQLAVELGITSKVQFLGMRSDIPELLSSFDWFALSSNSEGSPISIIEAMAAGCPIVSTNVGGISAMVRDGVDGILVDPEDEPAMVAAWVKLSDRSDLREMLGKSAKQSAVEKFDLRTMVNSYEALYTAHLNNKQGS